MSDAGQDPFLDETNVDDDLDVEGEGDHSNNLSVEGCPDIYMNISLLFRLIEKMDP